MDLPQRSDLNKKETVRGLAKAADKLRLQVLGSSASNIDTEEAPLMEDCGIFMGGDGSPSYTFDMLSAKDPEQYAKVTNFSGGFHCLLNMHQKINPSENSS